MYITEKKSLQQTHTTFSNKDKLKSGLHSFAIHQMPSGCCILVELNYYIQETYKMHFTNKDKL